MEWCKLEKKALTIPQSYLYLRLIVIKRFQRSFCVQFSCWLWPWYIIWKVNSTNKGKARLRDLGVMTTGKTEVFIGTWKPLIGWGEQKCGWRKSNGEEIFPGRRMKNFFSCGWFFSSLPLGKTPQNAFEKHGLLSMTQLFRISCETYFLF